MVLSRNNISVIKDSFIDVTNDIVPTIQYIVEAQGLNFIRDKVKIVFHNTPGFVTVGSTKMPCSTDLITLDKNLTQEEVEILNLYWLGFKRYEDTALSRMSTILANILVRKISKIWDEENPDEIVLHFAKPEDGAYDIDTSEMAYGFILTGNVLQMESLLYVETVKHNNNYEEVV